MWQGSFIFLNFDYGRNCNSKKRGTDGVLYLLAFVVLLIAFRIALRFASVHNDIDLSKVNEPSKKKDFFQQLFGKKDKKEDKSNTKNN
ncbi:MAG TPA: hypothetical protein VKG26_03570 [Bacteroidia bacterium]|nr:hypothetical protein [Bacteroidia bacterium]